MTGGGRTNVWDSQNRLVSCTKNGVTSTYTYGADGLRRSSTVNGITTYFLYDGSQPVCKLDSAGTMTMSKSHSTRPCPTLTLPS